MPPILLGPAIADVAARERQRAAAAAPPPAALAPTPNPALARSIARGVKAPVPGLATSIDDAAQPRDLGTFVSPRQRAENLEVAAAGAFDAGPEWGGEGGGIRSAAQMLRDLEAREVINAGHEQRMGEIDLEEARRGDPLSLATVARRKMASYEDSLPADATSHVRFNPGGGMRDYEGATGSELGVPTLGEHRQQRSLIAQAAARQNPKDMAEGALGIGRGRIAEELLTLRDQLADEVRSGKRTQEDADALWEKAERRAQSIAEMLKSGFPRTDPVFQ